MERREGGSSAAERKFGGAATAKVQRDRGAYDSGDSDSIDRERDRSEISGGFESGVAQQRISGANNKRKRGNGSREIGG